MSDSPSERAFRDERTAVLATLIRYVGDVDLAEDALQDAFVDALVTWQRDGVPARPGAWLTTTARHRAIDRLRRGRAQANRAEGLAEREPARIAPAGVGHGERCIGVLG